MDLPLFYGKPKDRALINPTEQIEYDDKERGKKGKRYPRDCIVYFYDEILDEAKGRYPIRPLETYWWGRIYEVKLGSSRFGMMKLGMGDSLAGLGLELLIAKGVRNVIAIGAAGGIRPSRIGDVVLVSKALRSDGVSYHYGPPRKYSFPDRRLNQVLEGALKTMKVRYRKGATWTTGAPFRETLAEIKRFQEEGVLCVEMEAAALFSIARFRNVKISSLLFVSDEVWGPKWNPEFHSAEYSAGRTIVLQAAVGAFSGRGSQEVSKK